MLFFFPFLFFPVHVPWKRNEFQVQLTFYNRRGSCDKTSLEKFSAVQSSLLEQGKDISDVHLLWLDKVSEKKEWKWIAGSSNLCLFKHYTLSALYATALLWSCYFSTTVNNFIEAILSILGKLTKKQWERVERVTESERENFIYILENRKYDPMYVSMCMHRYLQYSMHVCLFAFTDK